MTPLSALLQLHKHKEKNTVTSTYTVRDEDLVLELDLRDFDEIDAADERAALAYREAVLGLPARPGTVRR